MNTDLPKWLSKIEALFSEEGPIARAMPGYRRREGQQEMASNVLEALATDRIALLEAGTGTGKSLAYLLPTVMSGKRVIISTHTKALQDQLMEKDIPLARKILGQPFKAVRLKGRNNYLCQRRFEEFDASPFFDRKNEIKVYEAFRQWASETPTGDRDEAKDLPDSIGFWKHVSSGADTCMGRKCPYYRESFTTHARSEAAEADIVVVNHHLFFADLSLRLTRGVELLPDYEAVIFDEAHHLEEVCAHFFGVQISTWRVAELLRDSREYVKSDLPRELDEPFLTTIKELEAASDRFFRGFQGEQNRFPIREREWGKRHQDAFADLVTAIERLERRLETMTGGSDRVEALGGRARSIRDDLDSLTDFEDETRVRWGERGRGAGLFLRSNPLDVSDLLKQHLYPRLQGLALTSATLTTGSDFSFIKTRLGLDESLPIESSRPSEFDYANQALAYLPDDLPEPSHADYADALIDRIAELFICSGGRALALFTSLSMMERARKGLEGRFDFPIYTQGDASRGELLDRFRTNVRSVLLASTGFREGIDVVGPSLSLVILDKMPFASPGDPIEEARGAYLRAQNRNPFMDYALPSAVLAFRQSFGRLIRSDTDTGVFAMLDSRVWTKRYGRSFVQSLGPAPNTRRIEDVSRFFESIDASRADASGARAGVGT